jgi:hypothetical protein
VCEIYRATFEDGEVVGDPSEDRLFIMLGRLALLDNSNIVIEPCDSAKAWYVVISLVGASSYEVEFRDPDFRVHDLEVMSSKSRVARDVIIWLVERFGVTGYERNTTDLRISLDLSRGWRACLGCSACV